MTANIAGERINSLEEGGRSFCYSSSWLMIKLLHSRLPEGEIIPNTFLKGCCLLEHCVSMFPQLPQKRGAVSKAAEVDGRVPVTSVGVGLTSQF